MNRSAEELQLAVVDLGREQAWNHAIELPYGVWTASPRQTSFGKNLVKWAWIKPTIEQLDLRGKRVLDIGCNEGFFSLRLSAAGAREVVACDISEHRLRKARFVIEALGVTNVRLELLDVYSPAFQALGRFDFVLCLGFLHRIADLVRFSQVVAAMGEATLFEWKAHRYGNPLSPLALYDGRLSVPDDPHSKAYFRPSIGCVMGILKDEGMETRIAVDNPTHQRTLLLAAAKGSHMIPDGPFAYRPSRSGLFFRYTRQYLASVRDLILKRDSL
jgi:SAM-dependent methyltransferase